MKNFVVKITASVCATTLFSIGIAHGGPPLTIDDPGVLEPGTWEIIGAVTYAKMKGGTTYELPLADVSFGLTENTQASAVYLFVYSDPDGSGSTSGFGNLEFGYKWRFVNTETLQVSFAPLYAFGTSAKNAAKGVGSENDSAFLPVNAEYALGHWTVNAEVGYVAVRSESNEWAYGASLGHPAGDRTQVFLELYGGTDRQFRNNALNFHVGADVEITEQWHLLVSAGSGLREPSDAEQLDLDVFLGIQYFP